MVMQKFNARLVDYYMDKGGDDILYMLRKLGADDLDKKDQYLRNYLRAIMLAQQNALDYFLETYCEVPGDD